MDRAVAGTVSHLQHAAAREVSRLGAGTCAGPITVRIRLVSEGIAMTQLPEQQRRTITRTAVTLALIVFAIFAYTLWRGIK